MPGINILDSHNQKISLLRSLYYLANADNDLKEIELVYIKNATERLGVSLENLKNIGPDEPELELPDKGYKIYGLFHRASHHHDR